MLEKALKGSPRYWTWIAILLLVIAAGFLAYWRQLNEGLAVTGMSRDVSWGLYIANFTFGVGLAAGALGVSLLTACAGGSRVAEVSAVDLANYEVVDLTHAYGSDTL